MTRYEVRPIKWAMGPESSQLFSERVTVIELADEAGGEFVVVRQQTDQPGEVFCRVFYLDGHVAEFRKPAPFLIAGE